MAIGDAKRVLVLEADERDVLRAQQAIDRAEAATQRKRDQYLVAQLKGQGEVTKEMLTQARVADDLAKKNAAAAKAADTIGLSFDANTKKVGGLRDAAAQFDKKLGDIGKTLGGMAVGFGIQAGLSIIGELFKPPDPAEMEAFYQSIKGSSGALGELARLAGDARDRMRELAKAKADAEATDAKKQAVFAKYDPGAREKALLADLAIVESSGLAGSALQQAIHDTFQRYHQLADAATGAARATREYAVAARDASKIPPPGFGGFQAPWEGQPDLAADIKASERTPMADFDAMVGKGYRGETQRSGGSSEEQSRQRQIDENLKIAASYNKIGDALGFVADAAAESGGSMLKFEKLLLGGLMGAGRTYAKSQVKVELAKAAAKNAVAPGSGSGHLYAAAAWTVAAGVLGLGAASLGSSGGGGGGGGGGLQSGERYAGPTDMRGGGGREEVHWHLYSEGGFTQRELQQHARRRQALNSDTNAEG